MTTFITPEEAADLVPDGATVMIGGFMGCGTAAHIVKALAKSGRQNLTMICNDGGMPIGPGGEELYGTAKLIANRQITKMFATHVGLNPEVGRQMNAGEMEVVLIPQGSFAEIIRAGGAGLGGVITPTGVGTLVEESEQVLTTLDIEGRKYLVMKPLRADIAIIGGHTIDDIGNVWYAGDTRNFNVPMATAADTVIVEAERRVPVGEISPDSVVTPGILVDYGVVVEKEA